MWYGLFFIYFYMKQFDIISFDFWGTLVTHNPEYKTNRNIEIQKKIFPNKSIEEINTAFSFMKDIDIKTSETTSVPIQRSYLFDAISGMLGNLGKGAEISYICYRLYMEHWPFLLPNTKETIEYLHEKKYELVICSNTGFADAVMLDNTLLHYDILKYFHRKNRFYSDACVVAKPRLLEYIVPREKRGLHVGDREVDNVKNIENLETYKIKSDSGIHQIINHFNL